jgi:hypothetical protein
MMMTCFVNVAKAESFSLFLHPASHHLSTTRLVSGFLTLDVGREDQKRIT